VFKEDYAGLGVFDAIDLVRMEEIHNALDAWSRADASVAAKMVHCVRNAALVAGHTASGNSQLRI
jgi:hypothetical protein